MKINLVFTLCVLNLYHTKCAEEDFFNRHSGYIVDNTHSPYKAPFNSQTGLICLIHCKHDSNCLTANYIKETKKCSLYDCKIDTNNLVTHSSSVAYIIKNIQKRNSINYVKPCVTVHSLNGKAISDIRGITEIIDDTSYFIINDIWNNRILKLNENVQLVKSATISSPIQITNSHQNIYVYSYSNERVYKLNYDLEQISTIINKNNIQDIHFDLSNNNLYVIEYWEKAILIYHTNDEISFSHINTIYTSYNILSVTIHNDKIFTGSEDGSILVHSKLDYSQMKVMNNMCSNANIRSTQFTSDENMIYSCESPPMIKIVGSNGTSTTVLLNDEFGSVFEFYSDSKNRLWVGGNGGFIVYN